MVLKKKKNIDTTFIITVTLSRSESDKPGTRQESWQACKLALGIWYNTSTALQFAKNTCYSHNVHVHYDYQLNLSNKTHIMGKGLVFMQYFRMHDLFPGFSNLDVYMLNTPLYNNSSMHVRILKM